MFLEGKDPKVYCIRSQRKFQSSCKGNSGKVEQDGRESPKVLGDASQGHDYDVQRQKTMFTEGEGRRFKDKVTKTKITTTKTRITKV